MQIQNSERYNKMCEEIRKRSNFTTLRFHRLDDMVESIGHALNANCVLIALTVKKNNSALISAWKAVSLYRDFFFHPILRQCKGKRWRGKLCFFILIL